MVNLKQVRENVSADTHSVKAGQTWTLIRDGQSQTTILAVTAYTVTVPSRLTSKPVVYKRRTFLGSWRQS